MELSERIRTIGTKDGAWGMLADEVAQLEADLAKEIESRDGWRDAWKKSKAENEALRGYATHKPGCYESGKECICGLDALLTETPISDVPASP